MSGICCFNITVGMRVEGGVRIIKKKITEISLDKGLCIVIASFGKTSNIFKF